MLLPLQLLAFRDAMLQPPITAIGGLPGYTYSLDGINFVANNLFNNLCAGIYPATIWGRWYASTSIFNILTSAGPVITNTTVVNILCNGGNNGSITINTTGSTSTITYTLQPNNINNISGVFSNLIAGTYTVQIVDANGCGLNTVDNFPPNLRNLFSQTLSQMELFVVVRKMALSM